MRDAQIERLLGGYATNTLTASERQALFEAALEDQELFDALQDEQALRELLEDPVSRPMIQRALEEPEPEPPRRGFAGRSRFAHVWAWGLATGVAAGLLVLVLGPFRQPGRTELPVAALKGPDPIQNAATPAPSEAAVPEPTQPAPKVVQRRAVAISDTAAKRESAPERDVTKVAPEVARSNGNGQVSSSADATAVTVASPPAAQFTPGGDQAQLAIINKLQEIGGGIPYTITRRGADGVFSPVPPGVALQAGDSVQIVVHPRVSGSLRLFEQSPEGNWDAIQALQVTASHEYTVPPSPIQVNGEIRLRVVMTPGEAHITTTLQDAAKSALRAPKQRLEIERPPTASVAGSAIPQRALTTNITMVPGKAVNQ